MSLKQKSEAALLQIVADADLFAGQQLKSDESHEATLSLLDGGSISAIYTSISGRPNSKGEHSGQESGFLSLVVRSSLNQQVPATAENAVATVHAERVNAVRASVVVPNFAALLTSKATQPYACLFARAARSPVITAPARCAQDVFTWEVNHVEVSCT